MGKLKLIRQYFQYLSGYKGSIAGLFILSLISAGITIPIPTVYMYLIDHVIPNKRMDTLLAMVGILVGLLVANALVSFYLSILSVSVRKNFRSYLRTLIYTKLQCLPYERFSRYVSGDLVSRITRDLDTLGVLLPRGLARFLKDIVMIIGLVGVILYLDWRLTLVSGIMIPIFFLLFLGMMKTLEERARKNHEVRGQLQASLQEKIEGNRDIQLTNAYEHQSQSASEIIQESESVLNQLNIQEAKMGLVFALFPILGSCILWGLGGYLSIKTALTLGEIIAFSYVFNYLFDPISNLFSMVSELPIEITALERIFEVFPENQPGKTISKGTINRLIKGEIVFRSVSFGYHKSKPLIENLDLTLMPGTTTCIVGANGAGKSTLFSLMLNLYQPDSGEVKIDNIAVSKFSEAALRQQVALIPQHVFLFQGSIKDNILMGRKITAENFYKACRLSGVSAFTEKFENGLDTIVLEKGNNLSGGEKQKIAIARALVDNPQILLMDEPSNNLDEAIKASIQQGILLAKEGKTIVLITHDTSLLEGIDSVYELKNKTLIKKEMQQCRKK